MQIVAEIMHSTAINTQITSRVDHLVATAPDLAQGVAWVEEKLGVTMQAGGRHAMMGTHNYLIHLGPSCYLEVIAIDPAAGAPAHPRWFGLDALETDASPALRTWVAATNNLEAALQATGIQNCTITPMQRGTYSWQIALPADGGLLYDGIAPHWITWNGDNHPCSALPDQGCRLFALKGFHPNAAFIRKQLSATGFEGNVIITPHPVPALTATILTPSGVKQL